jgi:hypothetical protein
MDLGGVYGKLLSCIDLLQFLAKFYAITLKKGPGVKKAGG